MAGRRLVRAAAANAPPPVGLVSGDAKSKAHHDLPCSACPGRCTSGALLEGETVVESLASLTAGAREDLNHEAVTRRRALI